MSAESEMPSGLVTFLFTDIEGSTRLAQLLGVDYRPVLDEHRRLLRSALGAGGGVELFTEGDSFFFAFPDATAAITACVAAQRALIGHSWPPQGRPRVRMGLHSGWARPQGGEYASPEVHRAARIADAAHGGQILCSATTAGYADPAPADAWLRDLGLFRLRGFDGRERLHQIVAPGLPQSFPRPRTEQAPAHNLPAQFTSFVGRQSERARLVELVTAHRLVTVVGAGGAGKTRLAVEVAGSVVDSYPDGVWFVDLATVADPGLVAVAVAGVLGLRPEPGRPVLQTIAEQVASRNLLLVLDTCDAQVGAVGELVTGVLAAGGSTRVVATSREPLGLPGELVWRIPPLSLTSGPGGGHGDAVSLLRERTSAARGGVPVPAAELPHLTRIASRLEGLPLALELAAARLRVLGAGQLAERLDAELVSGQGGLLDTIDLGRRGGSPARPVAAGRHATLQAAVHWSYRTLEPDQARLLRRLSVFATPVEVSTAEWLLGDAVPALTGLADKSLLHPVTTGSADRITYAYRMLDPIRSFAVRELAAAGEERSARDQHVGWLLAALRRARLGPDGSATTLSLYRLDPLADEVRAGVRWCLSGGTVGSGLRLVSGLEQWWRERGLSREARLWLFRLYGRMAETGERVDDRVLARAYHAHALQAGADGEYTEQLRYTDRAEEHVRRFDDPGALARVLSTRTWGLVDLGDLAGAERQCRDLIAWAARHGVAPDALFAVFCLAQLLWRRGGLDEAAELLGAARPAEAARPESRGRRTVDHLLGMVALARGDLVAAHDHLVVALRARMANGFHTRAAETLAAMAVRCAAGGDPRTAVRLFGAVDTTRGRLSVPQGGFTGYWAQRQAQLRAELGDEVFDAAYLDGSGMSLRQATDLALSVDQEIPTEPTELSGVVRPGQAEPVPGS